MEKLSVLADSKGRDLRRVCGILTVVIAGLVLSGLTAFPLVHELNLLAAMVSGEGGEPRIEAFAGLTRWILKVREGLAETQKSYPFLAYGTDWLAFGHLVIAGFFVLPWREPVRYEGVLWVGVAACVAVIPTALICGDIRGIPLGWRVIDSCFGVFCLAPLGLAIRWTKRLENREATERK